MKISELQNEKSSLTIVIKILHEDNTCSQHVNHADTTNLKDLHG